ncbi:D-Ala-D-Ala carboxypeptidase family metallohydrolase [Nitratireductor sp. ZSWI3]|uniref:YcbK family protein n=1 Tax=Nitratireductor sp. ZSWI3 TaxID=2966359 RepID=UPI00215066E0|nr:D-Ala-D-Ala carboxypeptidase family metallohydrolase [Nitratireductor sp. ZSWI3]MCR4267546.1 D-Ala-D-Ala carboxypeptidase family metallohydrolase [Nitratireductor sp. ZSWI3]
MVFRHRGAGRPREGRSYGRGGIAAAFLSLLLASCSTATDPVAQLGLAPTDMDAASLQMTEDGGTLAAASGEATVPAPTTRPEQAAAGDPENDEAASTAAAETQPPEPASSNEEATTTASAEEKPAAEQPTEAATAATDAAPDATETAEDASAKKRDFLSAFFSARQPNAAAAAEKITKPAATEEKPKVVLAAATADAKPVRAALATGDALPGVRQGESLFEFSRKSGTGDADVDLYEDEPEGYQVASAAGLARLAPNGLLKQRESVDTACLKPALVSVLKKIERHYGKQIIVTSGYRSPSYNQRVRGARNSLHMYCAAADIQIPGISKWELARYARSMAGRGGVGTYCHTNSVHVDVGPERDWNWRCRRRK